MEFEAPGDQKFDILNVMPDYGGAYLWGAYNESLGVGSNIATSWGGYEDHLPISEKLQNQFHQWQLLFDNTSFEDAGAYNFKGQKIDWDWDKYHQEGLRLSNF